MTPLKLELEGFTCYRERATIEWGGTGAELFAVTGPTGAGKSTLLDAVTYALFGQTPRLGGRGLDSLLSPGATRMFVQLTFRAASGVFRVTRVAERRSAGLSTEVRVERSEPGLEGRATWRQLPESERVRDANRLLEQVVGLDYSGFTRSVLLPQGAFDEFLRGDAGERRRLLTALLGLDRVERVREVASRLAKDAEATVAALTARLGEDYAEVTAAAIRELRERGEALEGEARALEAALARLESLVALARERARVEAALTALARRREGLLAADAGAAAMREELEAAHRASGLAPAAEANDVADGRAHEAAGEAEEALAAAAAAADEVRSAQGRLDQATARHAARAAGAEAELAALAAAAPALTTLARLGASLAEAERARKPAWLDEERWTDLQVAAARLPVLEGAESEEASAALRLSEARADVAATAAAVTDLARRLEERMREGTALRAEAERTAAAHEAALRADAAAALRSHVHIGDDCPVCGNRVTALPEGAAGSAAATAAEAAAAAARRLEMARDAYTLVKSELEAAKARAEAARKAEADALERVGAAARARQAARAALAAVVGSPEEGAPDAQEGAEAAWYRERLRTLQGEAIAAHALAVMDSLQRAGVAVTDPRGFDPASRRSDVEAELKDLTGAVEAAAEALAEARRGSERATDAAKAVAARADQARADAERAAAALAAGLREAGFETLEEMRAALRSEERLAELAAAVATYREERAAAERLEGELRAELAGLAPLPDEAGRSAALLHDAYGAQLGAGRAEHTRLAAERATTADRLTTLEGRLERKRQLEKELSAARDQAEVHRQLALDLRSDRFQEYLMTHVQQRLARRASDLLKHVTDGRFDLHLLDGEYLVADAWAGGELRSAKTLSGGESFVASLALALALSDTLAGNAALGALFLDEGFGTLDQETLESVTGVLESLTREGRMVGVITHVAELSERLPARLVVRKGPAGSTVAWDA